MKKYLVLDIGNTLIDAYYWSESHSQYFKTDTCENCADSLSSYLKTIDESYYENLEVYISSVNRPAEKSVNDYFDKYNVPCKILSSKIMNDYIEKQGYQVDNTEILGGDLFADIIVSKEKGRSLIADFGTASKILLVEDKKFIGGNIFPGVYNCSTMLSEKTDLLEYVAIKVPEKKFSLDTDEAINAGATYGIAIMLKGWYEYLLKENPNSSLNLTITGGAGDIIAKALTGLGFNDYTYDKFRIIKGIISAFELDERILGGLENAS